MPGIVVGSVSVSVVPDAGKFGPELKTSLAGPMQEIARQLSQQIAGAIRDGIQNAPVGEPAARTGDKAGSRFADTFKARVKAALASMPDVEIGAGTTEAEQKIAELRADLQELSTKRVGIDIDAGDATALINRIKAELDDLARESPDIAVKADITRASAALAALQSEIDKIKNDRVDVNVGAFTERFTTTVNAAIRALPDAEIGADSAEADEKIAELRARLVELSTKRIGIDIDEGDALAELEALKAELDELGASSPEVRVKADTATAAAKLAEIMAQVEALRAEPADVDVDVNDHGSLSAVASDVAGLGGNISGLGLLIDGLITMAAPLGAALTAAFLGAAAAVAAVLGGVGVLALALAPVVKTMGLLDQQQKASVSSGGSVVRSMNQQANAAAQLKQSEEALKQARQNADDAAITSAERVKSARQSLANAERQATQQQVQDARAVLDAEYQLTLAAQRSTDAQQALNDAREQAARDLLSYADNAVDANLNLQQSQIDLTNAQAQYQQDLADPTVSPTQLQQDALNVAKAQQAIVEAQQRLQQATEDNNKAQAEGVDGAPGVVSAAEQVTAAQHAQQQATQALSDARKKEAQDEIKSAQSVASAEQGLEDAIREQAKQRRQSAYQIEQAQAAVASAMRAVQTASVSAGAAGGASLASINAQLAKTNPAVLAFAKFIESTIKPAFQKLSGVAAAGLLPGVQRGFAALLPVIPLLTRFVASMARAMGDLFKQASLALTSPFWVQFFRYVNQTAAPTLVTFARIMGNLAKGFAGLLEAFQPLTDAIGQSLLRMSRSFAAFGTGSGSQAAPFLRFMAYVKTEGPKVADMFGQLFTLIGHLVVALAPLGDVLVTAIAGFSRLLNSLNSNELLTAMIGIGALISIISGPAGLTVAIVAAAGLVAANWDKITGAFSSAQQWASTQWKELWGEVTGYLVNPVNDAQKKISSLFDGTHIRGYFTGLSDWVSNTWSKAWAGTENHVIAPVKSAVVKIGGWFGAKGALRSAFSDATDWVSGTFASAWAKTESVLLAPLYAARDVLEGLFGKKGSVPALLRNFVSATDSIWSGLESVFKKPITFLVNVVLKAGLLHAWDTIAALIPGMPKSLSNLESKVNLPKGWAGGGVLPGYAPGVDSIPAMLSPGEGILVPEAVRGIGGAAAVGAINAAYSPRAHFAGGGVAGVLDSVNPAKWISDFIGSIQDAYTQLSQLGTTPVAQILATMPKAIGSQMIDYVKSIPADIWNTIKGLASSVWSGITGLFGGGPSPSGSAKSIGQNMAAQLGWTGAQWSDLDSLWTRESGWQWNATNPSSGAYGIPQALPASKMAAAGADWLTNPATQIKWGLGYIAGRYGNPANAWAHELAFNWYDQGGLLPPGPSLTYNGTGQAELVAPRQSFEQIMANGDTTAASNNFTVYAQFGDETVKAQAVQVVREVGHKINDLERAGKGGTSTAQRWTKVLR